MVPAGNLFCGKCGHRMEMAAAEAPAAAPATPPAAAPATPPPPAGRMVLIRPDGTEGGVFSLHLGANVIGRDVDPLFQNDFYLSPKHVEITIAPGSIKLKDLSSLNGTFFKIFQDRPIDDGQVFRIGQELLRFDRIDPPQPLPDGTEIMGSPNPGCWGRLVVIIGDGVDGGAYLLKGNAATIGRENGDITFPEDGYVSGTHLRLSNQNGQVVLTDLNSSNGTFVRIDGEEQVPPGTFVLVGQQLFRVEVD